MTQHLSGLAGGHGRWEEADYLPGLFTRPLHSSERPEVKLETRAVETRKLLAAVSGLL